MKRNFNFLIDAFENLSGHYKFGVFIHENNWEAFNKSFKNALKITPASFMEGRDHFNIDYRNSVINVYKIRDSTSQIRGQRYSFIFWDELLKDPIVNEIIRPCATLSPGIMLSLNFREKCHYCICKTCAIAEINGGAPGCGNCKDCDLTDGCRSCNDYYNIEPIKNLNKENDK